MLNVTNNKQKVVTVEGAAAANRVCMNIMSRLTVIHDRV